MKRVLLIDGNLMMFKSFHASKNLNSSYSFYKGLSVGGLKIFFNTLNSLIKYIVPDYLLIAFDTKGGTFRSETFEDYKGGRSEVDRSIFEQFDYAKQILDDLNIKRYEIHNYEADDIIASASKLFDPTTHKIYVYSSDKDMLQMLQAPNIDVFNRKNKDYEHINKNNFYDKFGYLPEQVVDFKGIAGDSSDNLKGVNGVGPKNTIKLLEKYKTLENILLHINELPEKTAQKFINDKEQALMCKELAKLKYDIPLNFYDFDLKYRLSFLKNEELIVKLGLKNIIERFFK